MPKSRIQLINEIQKASDDSNFYVKGLSTMKKKDLEEVYNDMFEMKNNKWKDTKDDEYDNSDIDELENEKKKLEQEILDLENKNNEKVELDELTDEDYENSLEEDDIEDLNKSLKHFEQDDYDDDDDNNFDKKSFEKKITDVLKDFESEIKNVLNEFKKITLTDEDIDDIIQYHNNKREQTQQKIDRIIDEMPPNEDLDEYFYDYIDSILEGQIEKVEKFIS